MDVAALTESLRTGGEGGVESLFDRFAPGLYDYCLTLLDQPEPAGEAVCNTLLAAVDKVGQLADPERLEVWLFALARNECLRTARRAQAAGRLNLASVTGAYQRIRHPAEQELREVSALVRRHGLDHRGVAAVYGIPRWRAKSLATRGDAGGDRRITLPPAAELPADLRDRFLTDVAIRSRAAYRGELAGPYRRQSGFPVPLDRGGATQRNVLVAAAVVGIVTVALFSTLPFGTRSEVVLTVGKPANEAPLDLITPARPATSSTSASPSPTASPPSPAPTSAKPSPTAARTTTPPSGVKAQPGHAAAHSVPAVHTVGRDQRRRQPVRPGGVGVRGRGQVLQRRCQPALDLVRRRHHPGLRQVPEPGGWRLHRRHPDRPLVLQRRQLPAMALPARTDHW